MGQLSTLQQAAIDLISKYFGQSTAELYNGFFSGESDLSIINSVNEIMVDYLGEKKAKEEIMKYMGHAA
jgi:phage gp37-like protein